DDAGNVYITGSYISNSISFDGVTLANSQANFEDFFIAKYDNNGNAIWARHASGAGNDKAFGVGTDAAGDVVVTGHFSSGTLNFGTQTLFNSGGFDIFIVKYDQNGNLVWAKNPGGNGYDFNFSMEMDADGNAYVTGYFSSYQLTFGSITITNTGGDDIYVVKYDPSGTALWAQQAGGISYDYGYDVSVDGAGNVFLTGNFQSSNIAFGNINLTNTTGYADYFVVKYNSSGTSQWALNGVSSDYTFGRGCGADDAGNIYVTGLFGNSTLTLGNITLTTFAGATDMFIARYGSSNCNTVYYADADNDSYGNAAVTVTGCSAPVGYVSDSTDCNDADPTIYGPLTWYVDADNDGYGQPEINLVISCVQPAGYVSNPDDCNDLNAAINPGAIEIPNNGIDDDCDGLVDEFGTGISEVENVQSMLSIYPNPAKESFFIQLDLNEEETAALTIEIRNVTGQKIYEEKMPVNKNLFLKEIKFNQSVPEGIYFLKIEKKDEHDASKNKKWTATVVYHQ
ncbi:MAG: MopE-related protein, partial [Chitinophagales bacterium]